MKKIYTYLLASFVLSTAWACKESDDTIAHDKIVNVATFTKVKNAFGEGLSQSAEQNFVFPDAPQQIKTIKMYIKDFCENKDCDEWDRYANIYVKDKETGQWLEMGRFITPYWVGNQKLERGYEIDVTDFKSLLQGDTELKIYTETWMPKGRVYSVDFDFHYGTPDYKFSKIVPVVQYNKSSIDGIPYGEVHNLALHKNIQLPPQTELAYFRTIISGWGHAQPNDAGSRGCAEWCFRTHHIAVNGENVITHELNGLNCASNPVNNQAPGNWKPDRAGWCPGMAVPVRIDPLASSLNGQKITFDYHLQPWQNNGTNGKAFYSLSTFIVVKSNNPLETPVVTL